MPMLRPVHRREIADIVVIASFKRRSEDDAPTLESGTATGTPGDWWRVFAPESFDAADFLGGRRKHNGREE